MQKISLRDTENIKRDLEIATNGPIPSFYVSLFKTMLKADANNFKKLESLFPQETALFRRWKEFGIDLTNKEILV